MSAGTPINPLYGIRDGTQSGEGIFLPAIHEHKAALIGRKPHEVCYSAQLLADACIAEFNTYAPVSVAVGVDIYNIEPEAFGCRIADATESPDVPSVADNLPDMLENPGSRPSPDPSKSGRMPLMLEAVGRVVKAIASQTMVQAPISGPFTLAAELVGLENLIYAMFDFPEKVRALLRVCLQTAHCYGRALLATGAQVAVYDSRASCGVISPAQYREFVLPLHDTLLKALRHDGADFIPLIIGGNTLPVAESLFSVSPDLVVADFNIPPDIFLSLAERHRTIVRVNVNPAIFDSDEGWLGCLLSAAASMNGRSRAILGSGIVPYATPPQRLAAAGAAIRNRKKHKQRNPDEPC